MQNIILHYKLKRKRKQNKFRKKTVQCIPGKFELQMLEFSKKGYFKNAINTYNKLNAQVFYARKEYL